MQNIPQRMVQLLEKQTGRSFEQCDTSASLDELGIDSFDFIEFLFLVEDEFGIEINYRANDFSGRMKTVGDVIGLVESLVAARQDGGDLVAAVPAAS